MKVARAGRAWIQPMQPPAGHCYEDYYTDGVEIGTPSESDAYYLPATFATGSSWLCLHESDLDATFYGAKLAPTRSGPHLLVPGPAGRGGTRGR